MRAHLKPGGVLVFDPWLGPDALADGAQRYTVDRPDLKVACFTLASVRDAVADLHVHYLVAAPGGSGTSRAPPPESVPPTRTSALRLPVSMPTSMKAGWPGGDISSRPSGQRPGTPREGEALRLRLESATGAHVAQITTIER
jgi:hypothetical protein